MDEKQLLIRSSKLHLHHLVPRSVENEIKLDKKSYESRRNKRLLHEKCHLVLHKSKVFQYRKILFFLNVIFACCSKLRLICEDFFLTRLVITIHKELYALQGACTVLVRGNRA